MRGTELLKRLAALPADAEVVVDLGRVQVDVVDIVGLDYAPEQHTVALALHPADLRDAFAAREP